MQALYIKFMEINWNAERNFIYSILYTSETDKTKQQTQNVRRKKKSKPPKHRRKVIIQIRSKKMK